MAIPILAKLLAQPTALQTLKRALAAGRVHHAYLFDGPDGVGKELAAFGLAQALVCERRAEGQADACGVCSACTRVVVRDGQARPVHPDVVVLERGLYLPEQIGRRSPETQDISIDQVRTLVLARSAFAAHESRAKVFIVRRADELSVAAANALLKTLEEPGRSTHFVLLSAKADALLPTIRSRTLRVRFSPLPEDVVMKILVEQGIETPRAEAAAKLSRGSVSAAQSLADPEETELREAFVAQAMRALESSDLGLTLDLAEQAKKQKAGLGGRLAALAARLADQARAAVPLGGRRADVAATRYQHALTAIAQLDANASPQLAVESMLMRMRGT